jgi:hypothetical protein
MSRIIETLREYEVTCAACSKGFDVEGWKNIRKLL